MGIRKSYIEYFDSVFKWTKKENPFILELGNQRIRKDMESNFYSGKEYWNDRGFNHTSIDINGKDNAIKIDLNKISNKFYEYFDVITDFGVSCFINNFDICIKNIFNFCKCGGKIIHILPAAGSNWNVPIKLNKNDCYSIVKKHNAYNSFGIKTINGIYGKLYAFSYTKYI